MIGCALLEFCELPRCVRVLLRRRLLRSASGAARSLHEGVLSGMDTCEMAAWYIFHTHNLPLVAPLAPCGRGLGFLRGCLLSPS